MISADRPVKPSWYTLLWVDSDTRNKLPSVVSGDHGTLWVPKSIVRYHGCLAPQTKLKTTKYHRWPPFSSLYRAYRSWKYPRALIFCASRAPYWETGGAFASLGSICSYKLACWIALPTPFAWSTKKLIGSSLAAKVSRVPRNILLSESASPSYSVW